MSVADRIRRKLVRWLLSASSSTEAFVAGVRRWAQVALHRGLYTTDRTNTEADWDRVYLTPVQPVRTVDSEVVRAIVQHTEPADVLLEAGCGSGELSAQLALSGRKVLLLDFSRPVLERARTLFEQSGLTASDFIQADLTKPLSLPDGSVDWVWSSGVLEHWTDAEIRPVLREMARVARRGVISLVPSARCVFYRLGKALAEDRGMWPYGREMPRVSLQPQFAEAGLTRVTETTVMTSHAPNTLGMAEPLTRAFVDSWWRSLPPDDCVLRDQGYLLFTIGYKM